VRVEDSQSLTLAILQAALMCLEGSFDLLSKALGDITRSNLIIFSNMIGVRLMHAYSQDCCFYDSRRYSSPDLEAQMYRKAGESSRGGTMTMNRNDEVKKQRCFNADLIPVLAAKGFTVNRKPSSKALVWADWNRELRLNRMPA
jgi:hypothetical protein